MVKLEARSLGKPKVVYSNPASLLYGPPNLWLAFRAKRLQLTLKLELQILV